MPVLLLAAVLALQDPTPPPTKAPPTPAAQADDAALAAPAKPVAWNDKDAKTAVDTFAKAMKTATAMAAKSRALDDLGRGSNKLLVKPLAAVVQDEKSVVIKKRAAELLGQQPASEATPVIGKLLELPALQAHPTVLAELVRGLLRLGWDGKQWKKLETLFERDYAAERTSMQEAILDLVIATKEKQAVEMLLRNLDEPIPSDVEGAANPPAAYWEARWKAWKVWRAKVADALFATTGQRFANANEARAWLKKNPVR